jgi:peptidoglycan/xylan/chitin deacetylase (PgdA/CDA1 family)
MNWHSLLLNRSYRALQRKSPDVLWFGDESRREIALTFDDGPHLRDTPRTLDALEAHRIRASFFLVGEYVEQHRILVKRIHENGHQIGIHCYRHFPFGLEKSLVLRAQLEHTRGLIAEICNIPPETIKDIRPPYGAFTRKTLSMLSEWGYRVVMWNNLPPHWMQPVTWTIQQTLDQTTPGGVIVLHDGHGHGTKVSRILDRIIPTLKARGFEFVTIAHMLETKGPSL